MKKKCKVVMLPTEKATAPIGKDLKGIIYNSTINLIPHHLYILSDDEIKEDEWYLEFDIHEKACSKPKKADYNVTNEWSLKPYSDYCKKIIATTDELLGIKYIPEGFTKEEGFINTKRLPQPPQSFIEKYIEEYNKGNIIEEVNVKYLIVTNGSNKNELTENERISLQIYSDNTIEISLINELKDEHLVYLSDDMYLPLHYKEFKTKQPYYQGDGNHSVRELEKLCREFQDYIHQQQIIKQNCMKHIVELKFGVDLIN